MNQSALLSLDAWFFSPLGQRVSNAFKMHLQELPESLKMQMRGNYLLQLGAGGENLWLDALQYRQKWVVSPAFKTKSVHLMSTLKKLPLDSMSMNCVVSPLTLEGVDWNEHPLDEVDRVIKPMGYWVIFGINSWSLWALSMRLGNLDCYGGVKMRPMSMVKLKSALLHRGYEIVHLSPFYYIPPVTGLELINRLEILNELGKMISPCPSAFYCMIVQKYVSNVIRPARSFLDWGDTVSESTLQPIS